MHNKSQHLLFIAASWFSLQILCSMDNPVCCDKPAYSGCISECLIWFIFPPILGVNSHFRLSSFKNMKGNITLWISYGQFRFIYVTVEDCSQAQHVRGNLNNSWNFWVEIWGLIYIVKIREIKKITFSPNCNIQSYIGKHDGATCLKFLSGHKSCIVLVCYHLSTQKPHLRQTASCHFL